MNKRLLTILAIGTLTFVPIDGANATNGSTSQTILDPNSPQLVTGTSTTLVVPTTQLPIIGSNFWQDLQGASTTDFTQGINSFVNSGINQVQSAVQGAVNSAMQSFLSAGSSLLGLGGGGFSLNIDPNSIFQAAQNQVMTLTQQGINDAVGKMAGSTDRNSPISASADLLAAKSTLSISDAANYASGVQSAASAAVAGNPGLGTPLILSAVNAEGGKFISRAAIDPGAISRATGDIAVNKAKAMGTKEVAESVAGTTAADSSIDELGNIKKILEANASINSDGVIATSKLAEGNMNLAVLEGAGLALQSSEADRQIQQQQEEEAAIVSMQYKANYTKALLKNIGTGGATRISTSNLPN